MPTRPILATVAALISLAPLAPAQSVLTPPDAPLSAYPRAPRMAGKENAALLYYRAWDMVTREDNTTVSGTFDNDAAYHLTPEQIKVLEDNQDYVKLVMRAAATPDCDWGIQYDQGWEALLPHLSKMRATTRFLGADARRLLDAGKPSDAADRIAAIVRMSDQTRHDAILISALVGAAISTYAATTTDVAFELRALTPDSARTILNAFREVHMDDPFGGRGAIYFEAWGTIEWPRIRFTGDNAGRELHALVADTASERHEQSKSPLIGMNAAQLAAELDKARPFYDEALRVWDEPDAPTKLDALSQRVAAGEFGETAKVLAPAFSKARSGLLKAVDRVNATIKSLENFIATGQTPADAAAQQQDRP
jgi:hypothetical protein